MGKRVSAAAAHPFFSRPSWRQIRSLDKLPPSPTNRLFIAAKDLSQIGDASVTELGGLDRGKVTSLAFGQRIKEASHGLFDIRRVMWLHGGILPKRHPCYRNCRRLPKNRVPKKPNREVNFGQFLIARSTAQFPRL